MGTPDTIAVENAHMPPFFAKTPISIARGEGVWVWDEEGRRYLDLTAGWGVTSIGHAHPVIVRALTEQGARIIQNPDSGLTYSPARARLLELLAGILPSGLTRVFFTNSGAEANDAAVKLARKATGRTDVIATDGQLPRPHHQHGLGHRTGEAPRQVPAADAGLPLRALRTRWTPWRRRSTRTWRR